VAGAFDAARHPTDTLFLRLFPEIDYPNPNAPWATPDTSKSIAAFQYLVTRFRASLDPEPRVNYVWAPWGKTAGKIPLYWPGAAYVDTVGCSLWLCPASAFDEWEVIRSLVELMDMRYAALAAYAKSAMVCELAVTPTGCEGSGSGFGADGFQRQQMFDFFNAVKSGRYPLLQNLVYYNAADTADDPWIFNGTDYGAMDWTISSSVFTSGSDLIQSRCHLWPGDTSRSANNGALAAIPYDCHAG